MFGGAVSEEPSDALRGSERSSQGKEDLVKGRRYTARALIRVDLVQQKHI